jgi:hypothetical protein
MQCLQQENRGGDEINMIEKEAKIFEAAACLFATHSEAHADFVNTLHEQCLKFFLMEGVCSLEKQHSYCH